MICISPAEIQSEGIAPLFRKTFHAGNPSVGREFQRSKEATSQKRKKKKEIRRSNRTKVAKEVCQIFGLAGQQSSSTLGQYRYRMGSEWVGQNRKFTVLIDSVWIW